MPLMVTSVPPAAGPLEGDKDVTTGAGSLTVSTKVAEAVTGLVDPSVTRTV